MKNKFNTFTWIFGNPVIEDNVWIGAFCLIDGGYDVLKIGRGSQISSGAQILTHNTVKRTVSERNYHSIDSAPTEIGEFSFIGTNAVILMGSIIGHHSVVGAGAVVKEFSKFPPYSLILGVPAKRVGSTKKYYKIPTLSVVIPAYNEEENIKEVVERAFKEISKIINNFEIVLVNDGSTDNTGKIINSLAKRKRIRAVHHKKNKGFSGAMETCFRNAKNELILLAPADGQFDFSQTKKFLDEIKGYDVAVGYRIKNSENFIRKFQSKMFHLLLFLIFGIKLKEISTVSLWRKYVLDTLEITAYPRSVMILPELVYKSIKKNYKFIEVPIGWEERKAGEAKGRVDILLILITIFNMIKFRLSLTGSKV